MNNSILRVDQVPLCEIGLRSAERWRQRNLNLNTALSIETDEMRKEAGKEMHDRVL